MNSSARLSALFSLGLVSSLSLWAGVASADSVFSLVVFENASGGDVSSLDLSVTVVDAGSFLIRNESLIASGIKTIYFEEGIGDVIWRMTIGSSVGVDFVEPNTNKAPPGGNNLTPEWKKANTFFTADETNAGNGINPGESLTIGFEFLTGKGMRDLLGIITNDGTNNGRIAVHVGSIGADGFSVSAITGGAHAPLPGAAGMGLALFCALGVSGVIRRRE
jgi:hypothetical protein